MVQGKRRSPDELRIDLRIVFYQEAEIWIAHCLEMDVMGHGKVKGVALDMLLDAMATQISASIEVNNHANIFMPADSRFFEMYAAGKNVAKGQCEISIPEIQKRITPKNDVRIESISYREYAGALALA
jgi:hypothetical protein